eukprot:COSAG01_NODE_20390_length_956_cov_2.003501_1_plen_30_part_10
MPLMLPNARQYQGARGTTSQSMEAAYIFHI